MPAQDGVSHHRHASLFPVHDKPITVPKVRGLLGPVGLLGRDSQREKRKEKKILPTPSTVKRETTDTSRLRAERPIRDDAVWQSINTLAASNCKGGSTGLAR